MAGEYLSNIKFKEQKPALNLLPLLNLMGLF